MIMDLADPAEGGPCYQLYTKEFFETCKSKLDLKNGILVTQSTGSDLSTISTIFNKSLSEQDKKLKKVTKIS